MAWNDIQIVTLREACGIIETMFDPFWTWGLVEKPSKGGEPNVWTSAICHSHTEEGTDPFS
jgi:hypothetical protein